MARAVLFLVEGFEETEAIVTADILRRGEIELALVSLTDSLKVKGAHNIEIMADILFDEVAKADYDMLILPGGPGTNNYKKYPALLELIREYSQKDKYLAAICAAPSIFGTQGLLKGKTATCYPGFEKWLDGASHTGNPLEADGKIITAKGPGASIAFGLKLVEVLAGDSKSTEVQKHFMA